ncbi:MAG: DegQ family serine endoprotease [Rhodospirillaceae bacterium]|nr:DegQ family serine endoprotease [Rhodospirillaceae bacterium]
MVLRRGWVLSLAWVMIFASGVSGVRAAERVVPTSNAELQLSYAPLVRRTAPAVVNIYARKVVRRTFRSPLFNHPFFRRFFGDVLPPGARRERIENSLGSGVIVRPDGYIVTNNHVISGADEVIVALADRREFDADVVLTDERTDLAVLRIETEGTSLPHLELMDSDDIEVGDIILAIGNPFGVGQTVTSGIVSALARTQVGVADYRYFIQTDAAINPGNSGGAMVGLDGRLAGVNTAIFSKSGGSIGIGFAVPANMVRVVVESALRGGRVVRPWLGATGQGVTADIAAAQGLDRPSGVLVNAVYPKGPADRAGIKVGDIIKAIGQHKVLDPEGLEFRIATHPLDSNVELTVLRGERTLKTEVALGPPPEVPQRDLTWIEGRGPLAGARVGNLSPAFAEELGFDPMRRGVVVVEVATNSPARNLGLKPGDVLVRINGKEIELVEDVLVATNEEASNWRIAIKRGDRQLNVMVRR